MDQRVTESDVPGGEWLIAGIGAILAFLGAAYLVVFFPTSPEPRPTATLAVHVIEGLVMVGFGTALAALAYWLAGRAYTNEQKWWVALWAILGLSGVIAVVLLVQLNQILEGRGPPLQTVAEELLLAAGGGGLVGSLTGLTNADLRRERMETARQRDTFEFINDLLRHNLLNGIQVIVGYATLLEGEYDAEADRSLGMMRRQGERIAFLIQNLRSIAESASSPTALEPTNLPRVLEQAIGETTARYPEATIERELRQSVYVRADRFLSSIFLTLFANAIGQADDATPSMLVSVETDGSNATVSIVDRASDSPPADLEEYIQRGEANPELGDAGLGTYLFDTIVQRYDGAVGIQSGEDESIIRIELPLA